jgi:hypothetical protein
MVVKKISQIFCPARMQLLSFYLLGDGPVDTQSIIAALEAERDRLNSAIAALRGSRGKHVTISGKPDGRRRTLSPAARRKIGLAMKKRWAERKKSAA